MSRPVITYFSDLLCIWGHIAQVRLDELASEFGEKIVVEDRFCSVFADARGKTWSAWENRGGYEALNVSYQNLAKKYPHISIHPDVWTKTQPRSSTSAHLFVKAIQLVADEAETGGLDGKSFLTSTTARAASKFRRAFFEEGRDTSDWNVQAEIAEELDLNVDAIRARIHSAEAVAALEGDYNLAQKLRVKGSPTYVMNEGRQTLFGNVGYKLVRANVMELFREPDENFASWC